MDFIERFIKSFLQWDNPSASPWRRRIKELIVSYRDWNFLGNRLDVGIRYRPVVSHLRELQRRERADLLICDVGSGDIGLRHFLKKRCVCTDITMDKRAFFWGRNVDPIKASILDLPFRDGSFDAVVAVDVVEGIEPAKRERALDELFRTSRRLVILAVPFGQRSESVIRKLYERKLQMGKVPEWLQTDTQMGTPGEEFEDLVSRKLEEHPNASMVIQKNENLKLLQLRWFIENTITPSHLLFRPIIEPITRITKHLNLGKCYRRIYFVTKERVYS